MHSHHHHERWIILHVLSIPELRGREEDIARNHVARNLERRNPITKTK
jgi:hypothetical protein